MKRIISLKIALKLLTIKDFRKICAILGFENIKENTEFLGNL